MGLQGGAVADAGSEEQFWGVDGIGAENGFVRGMISAF